MASRRAHGSGASEHTGGSSRLEPSRASPSSSAADHRSLDNQVEVEVDNEVSFVSELILVWPSGSIIHRFENVPYDSVDDFLQRMEEGIFEHIGIPRCAVSEEGNWLQSYDLVHEDQVLHCGQYFSDLNLPPDAQLVLVRKALHSD